MRLSKTASFILCFVILISLLTGCGRNDSGTIRNFPMPSDDILSSNLDEHGRTTIVLRHDGTYAVFTDDSDDNFDLLRQELLLSKAYFEKMKKENRELAATATAPNYGDNPPGTVPDYKEYDGVSYEWYLKKRYEDLEELDFKDKFDEKTNKLKDRPAERILIRLKYFSDDWDNRKLDNKQLIQYYKKAFEMIENDPKIRKFVLKSVNLESYKTGAEAYDIEIGISENGVNKISIWVDVSSLMEPNEGEYYKTIDISL